MKRTGLIVAGVLLAVGLGLWYLLSNLDGLVKRRIESVGSDVLGTAVEVAAVRIQLSEGQVTLRGLSVANPEGFSERAMLQFDDIAIRLDLGSLGQDTLRIEEIRIERPVVHFEANGAETNFGAVHERLEKDSEATPADADSGDSQRIHIAEVHIKDIQASVASSLLRNDADVELGDLYFEALEGNAAEIAGQLAEALLEELTRRATLAMIAVYSEQGVDRLESTVRELRDQLRDRGGDVLESVRDFLQGEQ